MSQWLHIYCVFLPLYPEAMDLFDMGDGFPTLLDGVKRVQCPVLVSDP